MTEPTWTAKAKIAVVQRDTSIPPDLLLPAVQMSQTPRDVTRLPLEHSHFSDHERHIVTSSVRDILQNVHNCRWTSEEVTRAFLKSAAVAQQLTNCLTALLYDTALARAQELDAHLKRHGQIVGPLHGLPISLKDCFITPPTPSAVGLTAWAGKSTEDTRESVLVSMLHERGAVIHAKTNVPVAMMMMETDNHVTGVTSNPYNTNCSAGGSSGGESALLALYGSPLGIGTDIGGSIRIPSSFCNLFSLKPSFGRLPTYGARSGIPGNDLIFSVNGPMARNLDSINVYCEAMLGSGIGPWRRDPKCLPVPWRQENAVQRTYTLKLAFTPPHDGLVHVHPPIARALEHAKAACQHAGHDISRWQPQATLEALQSVSAGFLKLGAPAIKALLDKTGEPWFEGMAPYESVADGGAQSQNEGKAAGLLTGDEMRAMNLKRNELQKAHLDRWEASGVDAIIAPVSPWTAVRNGLTSRKNGMIYIGFTAMWSLMDVSVGVVPVTKVGEKDGWEAVGGKPEPFKVIEGLDERIIDDWDAEVYEGTPVCLQVIAGRLEEEKVLSIMRAVEDALMAYKERT